MIWWTWPSKSSLDNKFPSFLHYTQDGKPIALLVGRSGNSVPFQNREGDTLGFA